MLIPSTITVLQTRRYTSTLYIHHTIHGFGYNPMNDGGRYSIQSPFFSNLPPTRPTLSPPFAGGRNAPKAGQLLNGGQGCGAEQHERLLKTLAQGTQGRVQTKAL